MTKKQQIAALVGKHTSIRFYDDLALGSFRYETLRKLNPRQYSELHKRNIAGENFDEMVDALMLPNDES